MLARMLRLLILTLLPSVVLGQSMELSVSGATANNDPSTFLLQGSEVKLSNTDIHFLSSGTSIGSYEAFGISPDQSVIGLLKRTGEKSRIALFATTGDTLTAFTGSLLGDKDPSLAIYPFNNGEALIRDNINNFTFYNTLGEVSNSMSSSSGSEEGEAISEVVVSANAKTVVVYNPKIKRSGKLGSQAQSMTSSGEFENIFYSQDRYLKDVIISDDGNIVVAITAAAGTDDRVVVMDRYGNEFNSITTDEDLAGGSLSADLEYLTLYSGGRVMVYKTISGERLGATSSRSTVFMADYFPADDLLLVLTGTYSERSGILNGADFKAVNFAKRKITSEEFSGALGFNKALKARLERSSANTYHLKGASKQVEVGTNF
jgi:hypothetical protein